MSYSPRPANFCHRNLSAEQPRAALPARLSDRSAPLCRTDFFNHNPGDQGRTPSPRRSSPLPPLRLHDGPQKCAERRVQVGLDAVVISSFPHCRVSSVCLQQKAFKPFSSPCCGHARRTRLTRRTSTHRFFLVFRDDYYERASATLLAESRLCAHDTPRAAGILYLATTQQQVVKKINGAFAPRKPKAQLPFMAQSTEEETDLAATKRESSKPCR